MKKKKMSALIVLFSVLCLGIAAFLVFWESPLADPVYPLIVQNDPPPDPRVEEIGGIVTSDAGGGTPVTPFGDPGDVEESLTEPVDRPPEADPGQHERGAETQPSAPPPALPKTEPPSSSGPHAGDTNDKGQVWVPGFGWITPGNGNQGNTTGSDGDINKQVGDM